MNAPQTALARAQQPVPALSMDENKLIAVLENSLYPGADGNSIALVINYCRASALDPMQKPVHIVPMWDSKAKRMRDVIMPGIGLYRTQAARSGAYAGVTEPEFGPDVTENIGGVTVTYPTWCKVTVKRRGADGSVAEFTAVERWKENYAVKGGQEKSIAPNAMWQRRPYGQLAKCAEGQALRKAFPEFGAQPTAEEMEGSTLDAYAGHTIDGATGEVISARKEPAKPEAQAYPADQFSKNLPAWKKLIESGKKSVDDIIATVGTKGVLSEEQKAEIRKLAKPAGEAVTFAHVEKELRAAQDVDWLDTVADLINRVAEERQREELAALYRQRRAELEQA